ncbi:MAG: carbon storage regulator [Candidatus Andersenbacteria bacterium]|nr:carbon storage regulator [Candidatus Andersenbacteria bacterium]
MLVLTRGLKQQILIDGGLITITVLEVRGGKVRLGIEAPTDVPVRRSELGPGESEQVPVQKVA